MNLAEKHKPTHSVGFDKTIELYRLPFVAVPFSLQVMRGVKFR